MSEPRPSDSTAASSTAEPTDAATPASRRHDETPTEVGRPDYDLHGVNEPTHREKVQRTLAYTLVAVLGGTILASLLLLGFTKLIGVSVDDLKAFVDPFFAAVVALVSTVVGFYFGSEAGRG